MSKERLKQIFDAVQGTPLWSMQLIKVKAEREGVTYHDREICLRPEGSIRDFAHQLSRHYLSDSGIDSFASVDDYTGDVVGNVIYKLQRDNDLFLCNKAMLDPLDSSPVEVAAAKSWK